MNLTKCWCKIDAPQPSTTKQDESINIMFANCSEEDEIYPLTVKEIAEEQKSDTSLKKRILSEKYKQLLVENTLVFCKDGKLVIPKSLQHRAVSWYHHYLQHPGNTRLEETLKTAM